MAEKEPMQIMLERQEAAIMARVNAKIAEEKENKKEVSNGRKSTGSTRSTAKSE